MSYRLEFTHLLEYDTRELGIGVTVTLSFGQDAVELVARLDCGAGACVFERVRGEALGLDVESGYLETFSTATGCFDAYGHFVTLLVTDYELETMIYFAKDESFNRNVLGRVGFLDRILIGLDDNAGRLYLERLGSDSSI